MQEETASNNSRSFFTGVSNNNLNKRSIFLVFIIDFYIVVINLALTTFASSDIGHSLLTILTLGGKVKEK